MRLASPSSASGLASRLFAIALLGATVGAVVAWPVHTAQADDDEDDDDDDEDDDDGGGDEEEEDEEEDPKDQPPVTAGGLYTLKSYPIRELHRPLTITEKVAQVRLGLGVDVSAKGAFESFGLNLEGKYGLRDHVMALAGFTNTYNFNGFEVYAGIEAALAYDFIDFRGRLRFGRPAGAVPDPVDPDMVTYVHGDVKAAIDIGFPFRYVATKEIAIVALDTLISFDLDGSKPDLNPSIGISTNPIAPVSIVLFGQLQVVDFDTSADKFVIPATARVQFSPNQKLDLGLEFTFLDMKPPEPQKFYDNRFLLLYGQFRLGR
jgi:hypothetical protein